MKIIFFIYFYLPYKIKSVYFIQLKIYLYINETKVTNKNLIFLYETKVIKKVFLTCCIKTYSISPIFIIVFSNFVKMKSV